MKHLAARLTLFLFAACSSAQLSSEAAQAAPETVILPKGTEIKLVMAQSLNSKHAYVGQRVELKVAGDVAIGNALLVPRNTRVLGTVTIGKDKEGSNKNPHQVALQVDYIRLGDRHIALTGGNSNKGKLDTGTAVATTALFGLTGLSIVMANRTGEIPEGTEIKGLVAEDVSLPVLNPPPPPATAQKMPAQPPG